MCQLNNNVDNTYVKMTMMMMMILCRISCHTENNNNKLLAIAFAYACVRACVRVFHFEQQLVIFQLNSTTYREMESFSNC